MNCPKCGKLVDGAFSFCENCGSPLKREQTFRQASSLQQPAYQQPSYQQPQQPEKKENIATGAVGAFIGALIGALCIVLLGQVGYIASISGFVLAVCTLKGYELLGGKLGTAGIVICIVLMLATPYLSYVCSVAIDLMREVSNLTFSDSFSFVNEVIIEGEDMGEVYADLGMLYLFTLLGGFSTVWAKVKERKQ